MKTLKELLIDSMSFALEVKNDAEFKHEENAEYYEYERIKRAEKHIDAVMERLAFMEKPKAEKRFIVN